MKKLSHLICAASLFIAGNAMALEALPTKVPTPADNPTTEAKVELGKQLYFDPRLSVDGTVSCNTCHNVMASGTDSRPVSVGVAGQKGGRSAPTVWNSGFLSVQFWDGRANTLEDQAKGPILNPIEMGMPSEEEAVRRISAIPGYVTQFEEVFGGKTPVSYDNIAKAIAAYERTLVTPNSPFDRYITGDKTALNDQEIRGMETFENTGCSACHGGPNFAGPALTLGTGFYQRFPLFSDNEYVTKYDFKGDTGRHDATGNNADKHMWRVPTLRNVGLTAPYFHNGSVATLDEAVRVMAKTQLNKDLSDAEVADIAAFLNSLTGELPKQTMPILPATAGTTFTAE